MKTIEKQILCKVCGNECEMIEESFDYNGSHCNYGRKGTHHTGHYITSCCGDEGIEGIDGWHIEYDPKPIPDRSHDYNYWHDEHDGAIDGNHLCGTAGSVEDALEEINEMNKQT